MAEVIDFFNLFDNKREGISEKLKGIGLNPLPGNIHNHEEIINYLNGIQSQLKEELKDLDLLKTSTDNTRKTVATRNILNIKGRTLIDAVKCIEGNIEVVKKDTIRDFSCLKVSLKEEWKDMQTHPSTVNLVLNNPTFNTIEAIDAILA